KAVIIGAVLLVAGHFMMAFEGNGGRENLTIGATTYELQVEGRDQNRSIFAVNGDERTQIRISPEGVSKVGADPAAVVAADEGAVAVVEAAGFPAFTPTGGYSVETVRDLGFGEPILFFALSLIIVGVGF